RSGDGVESGASPAQAGQIGAETEFATEDRPTDRVIMVDHGMHDWNGFLIIDAGEAIEVHGAYVEVTAVATPCEVSLREHVIRRGSQQVVSLDASIEPVILKVRPVRDQRPIPTPDPFVGQGELAR